MAKITPRPNGPLLAQEVPNLSGTNGKAIDPGKPAYALCRCGQSQNKPFCDGSHTDAGFTSDNGDAKIRNKAVSYKGQVEGKEVTISYTPVLCGHIADCQRLHRAVFDPTQKPWIQPENGTLEGITAVIAACPSGALRMSVGEGEPKHIDSDEVSIRVVRNGPYIVKNVELEADFNGEGASQKEYILCRCGHSKNKPFCDGTHYDLKWRDH
ncbi:CDGSH iron-sulfur domain-containing protein [Flavimaricola marinus]|uniref:Iron-binding zinc finger CDGSH type n=1 Tax=Flavimaricola marinus TaxID=1819565 RepID=A0A238LFM7_9RHOB|nr:CDGSH iron-sulfur domain-containing protein [Flavimaricola marinus]SMY08418.1 Iron-binding zinc finger CDGSH type [Flavimaricola marinus]